MFKIKSLINPFNFFGSNNKNNLVFQNYYSTQSQDLDTIIGSFYRDRYTMVRQITPVAGSINKIAEAASEIDIYASTTEERIIKDDLLFLNLLKKPNSVNETTQNKLFDSLMREKLINNNVAILFDYKGDINLESDFPFKNEKDFKFCDLYVVPMGQNIITFSQMTTNFILPPFIQLNNFVYGSQMINLQYQIDSNKNCYYSGKQLINGFQHTFFLFVENISLIGDNIGCNYSWNYCDQRSLKSIAISCMQWLRARRALLAIQENGKNGNIILMPVTNNFNTNEMAMQSFEKSMAEIKGSNNAGKDVVVAAAGLERDPVIINNSPPAHMQYMEVIQKTEQEIMSFFNIPSDLMGDATYTNKSVNRAMMFDLAVEPLLNMILSFFSQCIYPALTGRTDISFSYDKSEIDAIKRQENIETLNLFNNLAITHGELREKLGMPEDVLWSDKYRNQIASSNISSMDNQQESLMKKMKLERS